MVLTDLEYTIRNGGLTPKKLLSRVSRRGFGASLLGGIAASRVARAGWPAAPTPDFTIAIIPDPQFLAESCPDSSGGYYASMMNWIVANRNMIFTSSRSTFPANIKAVVGVGDCVNATTGSEYQNAQTAWSILDAHGIAFITPPGNHDYAGQPSSRSKLSDPFTDGYFSAANRASVYGSGIGLGAGDMARWVGSFDSTGANTAVKFVISGVRMLILAMDFFAGTAAWSWAAEVMRAHPDCECYITTHAWLTTNGTHFQRTDTYGPDAYSMGAAPYSNSADEAWNSIGVNTWPNLFGIFSGHDLMGSHNSDPAGVASPPWFWKQVPVKSSSPGGQTVQQLFANSQQIDHSCNSSAGTASSGAGQMASVFLLTRRPVLGLLEGRMISTLSGDWFGHTGASWSASETLLFSVPFTGLAAGHARR